MAATCSSRRRPSPRASTTQESAGRAGGWPPRRMRIPINDLKRHHDPLAAEIQAAVERVLSRGWYILGPEVEAFEAEFAGYCGVEHAIGVASGTDALELALRAVGAGPGAEVATVANAGMYSTTAIL